MFGVVPDSSTNHASCCNRFPWICGKVLASLLRRNSLLANPGSAFSKLPAMPPWEQAFGFEKSRTARKLCGPQTKQSKEGGGKGTRLSHRTFVPGATPPPSVSHTAMSSQIRAGLRSGGAIKQRLRSATESKFSEPTGSAPLGFCALIICARRHVQEAVRKQASGLRLRPAAGWCRSPCRRQPRSNGARERKPLPRWRCRLLRQ